MTKHKTGMNITKKTNTKNPKKTTKKKKKKKKLNSNFYDKYEKA